MRLRFKVGLVATIALWAFLEGRGCAKLSKKPLVTLPPGDIAQIHVDPSTHRGIIVTPSGTHMFTLPDRDSIIDVRKDGTVKVTSPQLGFECHPFMGAGYGQGTRLYLGADLAYWKRMDLGLGTGTPNLLDKGNQNFNDFRIGAFASYNVWSNSRLTLGYDTQKTVHLLVSIRL